MHTSCTVEMADVSRRVDVAVIDEIQMMADPNRGWAWTRALQGTSAMSGSLHVTQTLLTGHHQPQQAEQFWQTVCVADRPISENTQGFKHKKSTCVGTKACWAWSRTCARN